MSEPSAEQDHILTEADLARLQASAWPLRLPTEHLADIDRIVRQHVAQALRDTASVMPTPVPRRGTPYARDDQWRTVLREYAERVNPPGQQDPS